MSRATASAGTGRPRRSSSAKRKRRISSESPPASPKVRPGSNDRGPSTSSQAARIARAGLVVARDEKLRVRARFARGERCQGREVVLQVRERRQRRQEPDRVRALVGWESFGEVGRKGCRRRAMVPGAEATNAASLGPAGPSLRPMTAASATPGDGAQGRFRLRGLDPVAADLELAVAAADELEEAVRRARGRGRRCGRHGLRDRRGTGGTRWRSARARSSSPGPCSGW